MYELDATEYGKARGLFDGFDYSLSIQSAIEGNNPGRIFVDDPAQPRTALALTIEGYLLAGDDGNPTTNEALRRLLREQIFTGKVFVNGDWSMSLAVHPETWEARLPELIPTHEIEKLERYHYLCRAVKLDWRNHVPDGYTVHRVDRALLHSPDITFPEPLREWGNVEEVWGSVDNLMSKGVSFCIVHGNEVVSWCVSDCVAGDRISVGIVTRSVHRRRGLATVAVAATVEYCLSHGFSAVGWHCNADNVGSWKTAEKVGFERAREYAYYFYIFDPVDHLAELGWYHFKRGEYDRTTQYYERVFASRDDNPDYYYHLAAAAWSALRNRGMAAKYLNLAVDKGWTEPDYTRQVEEFRFLHGTPAWDAVLGRMQGARDR